MTADPVGANEFNATLDLIVDEVNGIEDGVVGILSNPHEETVSGIGIIGTACFDESGQLLNYNQSSTNPGELGPGQTQPVQVSTSPQVDACPFFLLAGNGTGE